MTPTVLFVCVLLTGLSLAAEQPGAQPQMDPALAWTTVASHDIRIFPNPETQPLDSPGLVYYRVDNIELKLNVFTPGSETVVSPTIICTHGGGRVHYTTDNMIYTVLPYLARGMDVVDIDYRQANQARTPAAVEDCRSALHCVFQHAAQYGFDPKRIVVGGLSAGGHLVLITGMLDQADGLDDGCAYTIGCDPVKVAAIVDFFGPTSLAEYLHGPRLRAWAVEWMADVPNPAEMAKRVSPLTYVRPGLRPTIVVHGMADGTGPFEQSQRMHDALDKAGVPNELVAILNGGHGAYPDDQKIRAQAEVFKFLERYGILSPIKPNRPQ